MDLTPPKDYLFIYRSTELQDHYIIIYNNELFAKGFFEKISRTGDKYGVPPADGIPYAYPHYSLEKVLQSEDVDDRFVDFLEHTIAEDKVEGRLGTLGWYILNEVDLEKWKNLYQAKLEEQTRMLLESSKAAKRPEQVKMF